MWEAELRSPPMVHYYSDIDHHSRSTGVTGKSDLRTVKGNAILVNEGLITALTRERDQPGAPHWSSVGALIAHVAVACAEDTIETWS
jgi:hypothetical protein